MTPFELLSLKQKRQAIRYCFQLLLEECVFENLPTRLQSSKGLVESAILEAEVNRTPWFAAEFLNNLLEQNPDAKDQFLTYADRFMARVAYFYKSSDRIVNLDEVEKVAE